MNELIRKLSSNTNLNIKGDRFAIKTKTWYSIEEDETVSYIKCELNNNKVLVIIPDDELIYIGEVVNNMKYRRISNDEIEFEGRLFHKTGEGHQFIKKIEFGKLEEVEGQCIFEDYESDDYIISLGILSDKQNIKADVYANIITLEDIEIIE